MNEKHDEAWKGDTARFVPLARGESLFENRMSKNKVEEYERLVITEEEASQRTENRALKDEL